MPTGSAVRRRINRYAPADCARSSSAARRSSCAPMPRFGRRPCPSLGPSAASTRAHDMPRTNVVGTTAPSGSGAQQCAQAGEREHRTDSTARDISPTNDGRNSLTATPTQLIGLIKAHIAKGDKAKEKADQHYIAAGQHLKTLKARHAGTWTEWEALLKEKIGIGKSRASELMQIADGTKTVEQVRAGTAQRMKQLRSRSPSRDGENAGELEARPAAPSPANSNDADPETSAEVMKAAAHATADDDGDRHHDTAAPEEVAENVKFMLKRNQENARGIRRIIKVVSLKDEARDEIDAEVECLIQ